MKSRGLRKNPTCSYGAIWSVGFCSAPALRQSNTFTPIKSRNLSNQRGTMQTSVFSLADQIVAHCKELDQMIQSGDPEAVRLIAGFGTVNLFSFATKYCCYHNTLCYGRDDYSIYDNIVADVIPCYLDVRRFYISQCRVKKEYLEYKRIIDTLITVHGLQAVPQIRRKMDHFLWFTNRDK